MTEPSSSRQGLLRQNPAFVRFWVASTVSDFGTYITTVALSVLILVVLNGTAVDQGLVNAARWAPYLMFGLVAGIWVDRTRKRTVLVAGDLGRGLVLAVLCITAIVGVLSIPALLVLMFLFGILALMSDAAYQSFLPQLVPRPLLVKANARLQQSDTVAQTSGGAIAGGLVALVSAPFALLIDAVSYFFSGAVLLSLRSPIPEQPAPRGGTVSSRIAEGLRWVYGHEYLAPMAWTTHLWFIGSAMMGTVVPVLLLKDLGIGALGLGLVTGCAGIGAVIGTLISTGLGQRLGTGWTIIAAALIQPFAVGLIALAPLLDTGPASPGSPAEWPPQLWGAFALAASGQLLFGFALGTQGPLEMGYRQAVTPDRLLARMSATMRSINRGMIVVGAPLGGAIAASAGTGTALWIASGIMLVSSVSLLCSRVRHANIDEQLLTDDAARE
ncbi:MFS transporter [Arthrobacter roseus]|uniref:MFS transporter n=1 Tax=Arthrobacter roseus TaxID=136274 RepID=UPI001EF8D31E|nr:MFS transporter [Arthrobacter roseus]MBM7849396.1 MFS family permease [Arthrobacter roseus]